MKGRLNEPALLIYLVAMDWIEELFGLSPDAGTGLTEMLIALAVILALVAIAWRVAERRRASR